MASFQQRESGYWQVRVRRKGQPVQSKSFKTKTEGEVWARAVESKMDSGSFVSFSAAERTTFREVASQFTTDFAPYHYRGAAWRRKLARLTDRLGDYALTAITPPVVSRYRDDRMKDMDPRYTKSVPKRISPATVKSEIDLLSKVLDVATKEFGIPLPMGNPVKSIRKPKSSRGRDRRLTGPEWGSLEAECRASRNPWLLPAMNLAVETAMRQGELLQLEWSAIDKKRHLALLLDPSKIKTEEPRAVPLSSRAMAVIDALPCRLREKRLFPIGKATLYGAFKAACRRAGIRDFSWHDLRHEALSRLAERGDLSVLELAAVSGHKTLQMLKRYTHLQAEKLAAKLG